MPRTRDSRGAASEEKADSEQHAASLRAALDRGIESAQAKLSEIDSGDLKDKKEAAALLEKLLKLRKEFAKEKERPTEIQLIWNTSEDDWSDSE